MPKLDLRNAIRIKGAGGEINALKGHGFSWIKPSGDVDPILAYFQSTGANGAYYTPWDKSTLFQDAAGTIPANETDPIAYVGDNIGNKPLFQNVSSSRPILGLDGLMSMDGVDDWLDTGIATIGNANFTSEANNRFTVFVVNSSNASGSIISRDGDNAVYLFRVNDTLRTRLSGSGAGLTTITTPPIGLNVYSLSFDGTTALLGTNKDYTSIPFGALSSSPSSTLTIGSVMGEFNNEGLFGSAVLIDRAMTQADKDIFVDYLLAKHGVVV